MTRVGKGRLLVILGSFLGGIHVCFAGDTSWRLSQAQQGSNTAFNVAVTLAGKTQAP